jgi:chromate transport protein ChrA
VICWNDAVTQPLPGPDPVPVTVQTAVIVTWFCCALATLVTVVLSAFAAFVGSVVLPEFGRADRVDMVLFVVGSAAALLATCAMASTGAWFVRLRHRWARNALAGCSALVLLASVVIIMPLSVVAFPGTLAVLVLLFLPQSNAGFRSARAG